MTISAGNANVLVPTFQPGEQQHRRRIATWALVIQPKVQNLSLSVSAINTTITGLSNTVSANAVVVAAAAGNASGQSMSTGATVVTNWLEELDTNAAFNPSTGVFTVPVTGLYRVYAALLFNNLNYAAGGYATVRIRKNGTNVSSNIRQTNSAGNVYLNPSAEAVFSASAGDLVTITGETGSVSAGAQTLYASTTADAITYNRFQILKVK